MGVTYPGYAVGRGYGRQKPTGNPRFDPSTLWNYLTAYWSFNTLYQSAGTVTVPGFSPSRAPGFYGLSWPVTGYKLTPARFGLGVDCNSGNANRLTPTNAITTGTTFSIETVLKVRTGRGGAYNVIINQDGVGGLYWDSGNFVGNRWNWFQGGNNGSNTNLSLNTWYHLVVSVSGGNLTFYTNGKPDGTMTGLTSINLNNVGSESGGTQWLDAIIDYMRFYGGYALAAPEVDRLYAEEFWWYQAPRRQYQGPVPTASSPSSPAGSSSSVPSSSRPSSSALAPLASPSPVASPSPSPSALPVSSSRPGSPASASALASSAALSPSPRISSAAPASSLSPVASPSSASASASPSPSALGPGTYPCGQAVVAGVTTAVTDPAGTTITSPPPAGTRPQDLLLAFLGVSNSRLVGTPPTGWTLAFQVAAPLNTEGHLDCYQRVADGSALDTPTFTLSVATAVLTLGIARITGQAASSPINASDGTSLASGTTNTQPVTTTVPNCLILRALAINQGASVETITAPAGTNTDWNFGGTVTGANGDSQCLCDQQQPAAGSTGTPAFTLSAAGDAMTMTVAIAPNPCPPSSGASSPSASPSSASSASSPSSLSAAPAVPASSPRSASVAASPSSPGSSVSPRASSLSPPSLSSPPASVSFVSSLATPAASSVAASPSAAPSSPGPSSPLPSSPAASSALPSSRGVSSLAPSSAAASSPVLSAVSSPSALAPSPSSGSSSPAGCVLVRTTSGLIFRDTFASLSAWTDNSGGAWVVYTGVPCFVCFDPHPTALLGPDGGANGAGLREPQLVIDDDGTWKLLYDSGTGLSSGDNGWRQFWALSTDRGLTWSRQGPVGMGLNNGSGGTYAATATGWLEKRGSTYYDHRVVTNNTFAAPNYGLPAVPYSWDIWTAADIHGPWTFNQLIAPGGASWDTDDVVPGSVYFDGTTYTMFAEGTLNSTGVISMGYFTSSSPTGTWTIQTVLLNRSSAAWPNTTPDTTRNPENPKVWFNNFLQLFVMTVNVINPAGNGTDRNSMILASTITGLASAPFLVAFQYLCPMDQDIGTSTSFATAKSIGVSAPVMKANSAPVESADGFQGIVFDTSPTGASSGANPWQLGRSIYAAVLEPSANAARNTTAGATFGTLTHNVSHGDFVAEFALQLYAAQAATDNIAFDFRSDGGGASWNGYRLLFPNFGFPALQKFVAGSPTTLQTASGTALGTTYPLTNRIRVSAVGSHIQCWLDGEVQIDFTDSTYATGTQIDFAGNNQGVATDVRLFHMRKGASVTVTGLVAGAPVVLRDASGLPVIQGTAAGASLTLAQLNHYPLHSMDIGGVNYKPQDGGLIWGGDTFNVTCPPVVVPSPPSASSVSASSARAAVPASVSVSPGVSASPVSSLASAAVPSSPGASAAASGSSPGASRSSVPSSISQPSPSVQVSVAGASSPLSSSVQVSVSSPPAASRIVSASSAGISAASVASSPPGASSLAQSPSSVVSFVSPAVSSAVASSVSSVAAASVPSPASSLASAASPSPSRSVVSGVASAASSATPVVSSAVVSSSLPAGVSSVAVSSALPASPSAAPSSPSAVASSRASASAASSGSPPAAVSSASPSAAVSSPVSFVSSAGVSLVASPSAASPSPRGSVASGVSAPSSPSSPSLVVSSAGVTSSVSAVASSPSVAPSSVSAVAVSSLAASSPAASSLVVSPSPFVSSPSPSALASAASSAAGVASSVSVLGSVRSLASPSSPSAPSGASSPPGLSSLVVSPAPSSPAAASSLAVSPSPRPSPAPGASSLVASMASSSASASSFLGVIILDVLSYTDVLDQLFFADQVVMDRPAAADIVDVPRFP